MRIFFSFFRTTPLAVALSVSLILSTSISSAAEEPGAQYRDAGEITEVVVTATRYEEAVQNIPANITVITEEEIQKSTARNVPELLRTAPGILVNDVNSNRKNYTIDMRGFGESAAVNTLVLVDGRRINSPDLSGADWTLIPLDRIERIEIIRGGSGAVLYGDNAAGGVVNIITKEADRSAMGIKGAYGSFNTYNGDAYIKKAWEKFFITLTGSYASSDGFRDNSDSETTDAGLNVSFYETDAIRWNLSSGYHRDETGLPGAIKESDFNSGTSRTDSVNPDDFVDTKDYYFEGGPEIQLGKDGLFKIDASYRKREADSFFSFDFLGSQEMFEARTAIKTIAVSPQVILKNNVGGSQHSLTFGVDYEKAEEDISNALSYDPPTKTFDLSKENYGFYVHDDVRATDRFSISAGYRYDKAKFEFNPGERSVDENIYDAGVNYRFGEKSYAYFGYSRSFRYPVLDEYFSFFLNMIDPSLVSQRSDNYDVGARFYMSSRSYIHLNFFRIDTKDEIFFNPVSFANENLDGKSRRQGVEFALTTGLFKWLSMSGSYTYTDSKILGGFYKGNDMPNVPYHKATLSTDLELWEGFSAIFSGIYIGERRFVSDFGNTFSRQKGYIVVNTKFRYRLARLTAFLDINNIFNKNYSEYGVLGGFPTEKAYYPSPDRNFLVGLSVDL